MFKCLWEWGKGLEELVAAAPTGQSIRFTCLGRMDPNSLLFKFASGCKFEIHLSPDWHLYQIRDTLLPNRQALAKMIPPYPGWQLPTERHPGGLFFRMP